MPNNVLPLHPKQTFPPIIWIFTEGEGDGIEPRLPIEIFSTLPMNNILWKCTFEKWRPVQSCRPKFLVDPVFGIY